MKFEWDEKKRLANLEKHGIDFRNVPEIFYNPYLSWKDDRHDYGEVREIIIGDTGKTIIVAVATDRAGKVIRIISARRANKNERKKFKAAIKG